MCFATMALVAGVAGGVMQAGSIMMQGDAQAKAARYQAAVANNNAIIAEQNAQRSEQAGQIKAQNESMKAAAVGGRIRAAMAANGVDPNTGSAVDVQESQREQGKFDTETVLSNSQLEAYGYRSQATNFKATAGLKEGEADAAEAAAPWGAAGSLLGNASTLGFKYGSMKT